MVGRFFRMGGLAATSIAAALLTSSCLSVEPITGPGEVPLMIDEDGRIFSVDPELGIEGHFYAYADSIGNPSSCVQIGKHAIEDCSTISSPTVDPDADLGFARDSGGGMCLRGTLATVLSCCTGESDNPSCSGANELNCLTPGLKDHSTMWGAGMGFDFYLVGDRRDGQAMNERQVWNASEHDVVGIGFDVTSSNLPGIRVEFPMHIDEPVTLPPDRGTMFLDQDNQIKPLAGGTELPGGFSTEWHPYGSPFWKTADTQIWGASPIKLTPDTNEIYWEDVIRPPENENNYLKEGEFDGDRLYGVQFHALPLEEDGGGTFSFCIENLRLLTEP